MCGGSEEEVAVVVPHAAGDAPHRQQGGFDWSSLTENNETGQGKLDPKGIGSGILAGRLGMLQGRRLGRHEGVWLWGHWRGRQASWIVPSAVQIQVSRVALCGSTGESNA